MKHLLAHWLTALPAGLPTLAPSPSAFFHVSGSKYFQGADFFMLSMRQGSSCIDIVSLGKSKGRSLKDFNLVASMLRSRPHECRYINYKVSIIAKLFLYFMLICSYTTFSIMPCGGILSLKKFSFCKENAISSYGRRPLQSLCISDDASWTNSLYSVSVNTIRPETFVRSRTRVRGINLDKEFSIYSNGLNIPSHLKGDEFTFV